MADNSAGEKTEQPTAKRLRESRTKGRVPQSEELKSAVSIIFLIGILFFCSPTLLEWFIIQVRNGMSCNTNIFADSKSFLSFSQIKIGSMLTVVAPVFIVLVVGAIVSNVLVSGINYAPKAVELKFDAVNPVNGFKNLINAKSMVKLLMSIAKLVFISFIVWLYLRSRLEQLAALRWAWTGELLFSISRIIFGLVLWVSLSLALISAVDVIYQKWKYIEDLKMTKQEVKEENRASEGSPEVKRRIRQLQFEMSLRRMMTDVPKADVVLVNPTHYAVALRYDSKTMEAPMVVAKGADHLAEKIREIARAYGVPIIRRPELTRAIYATANPGSTIASDLFMAVAEVLAMVYRLRHRR